MKLSISRRNSRAVRTVLAAGRDWGKDYELERFTLGQKEMRGA